MNRWLKIWAMEEWKYGQSLSPTTGRRSTLSSNFGLFSKASRRDWKFIGTFVLIELAGFFKRIYSAGLLFVYKTWTQDFSLTNIRVKTSARRFYLRSLTHRILDTLNYLLWLEYMEKPRRGYMFTGLGQDFCIWSYHASCSIKLCIYLCVLFNKYVTYRVGICNVFSCNLLSMHTCTYEEIGCSGNKWGRSIIMYLGIHYRVAQINGKIWSADDNDAAYCEKVLNRMHASVRSCTYLFRATALMTAYLFVFVCFALLFVSSLYFMFVLIFFYATDTYISGDVRYKTHNIIFDIMCLNSCDLVFYIEY